MANNLKDHLKEVADAIRAKKGTTDLINPQDFATEIEGISGGGDASEKYRYYLLDWGNIYTLEGYTRELGLEIVTTLDMAYYTAYVMPSKAIFTGSAVINSDPENWGLSLYRAMRWKASETSFDEETGGMSPKEFLASIGADMPFVATMAERMTECTKEEFEASITA